MNRIEPYANQSAASVLAESDNWYWSVTLVSVPVTLKDAKAGPSGAALGPVHLLCSHANVLPSIVSSNRTQGHVGV